MMGRNRLPDKIKDLRGTSQPCRKTKSDFKTISKLPPPPPYFSKTAKKIYKTVGANILSAKILTPSNLPQFVAYCNEIAIYFDANEEISTLAGRVEEMSNESGSRTFPSGMQRVAAMALQSALKLGREFGFTPATVSRIGVTGKKDNDEFSNFMNS